MSTLFVAGVSLFNWESKTRVSVEKFFERGNLNFGDGKKYLNVTSWTNIMEKEM
jgi:hypothetical protein